MNRRSAVAALSLAIVFSAAIQAHVTVLPREAIAGAQQIYTVRVPTEGNIATTSVELEVPQGLQVIDVAPGEGFTFAVKRENDRIVSITWTRDIKPKERAEFTFTARNPSSGDLRWKAHQHFADGSTRHWIGERGTKKPASVTNIVAASGAAPAAADPAHGPQEH